MDYGVKINLLKLKKRWRFKRKRQKRDKEMCGYPDRGQLPFYECRRERQAQGCLHGFECLGVKEPQI